LSCGKIKDTNDLLKVANEYLKIGKTILIFCIFFSNYIGNFKIIAKIAVISFALILYINIYISELNISLLEEHCEIEQFFPPLVDQAQEFPDC
jgi:hypothetical protein